MWNAVVASLLRLIVHRVFTFFPTTILLQTRAVSPTLNACVRGVCDGGVFGRGFFKSPHKDEQLRSWNATHGLPLPPPAPLLQSLLRLQRRRSIWAIIYGCQKLLTKPREPSSRERRRQIKLVYWRPSS